MLPEYFVYVGAVIFAYGGFGYWLDTIKGKVQPNRVSWFIWFLAPSIAFFAQVQSGVHLEQSLLTFMAGLIPLLIFLASFINKKSYWELTKRDIICGILSLLGLALWYVTGTGLVAILFAILADLLAAVPTVIKSYTSPETENWVLYFTNAVSALLTLLTIKTWNPQTYAFPLYLFLGTLALSLIIKFKLGKRSAK